MKKQFITFFILTIIDFFFCFGIIYRAQLSVEWGCKSYQEPAILVRKSAGMSDIEKSI